MCSSDLFPSHDIRGGGRSKKDFAQKHDTILRYSKSNNYVFNEIRIPYKEGSRTDDYFKSGQPMNKNGYSWIS